MKRLLLAGLLSVVTAFAFAQTYSFRVKVVGTGKPVILIPGLTCTGDVWDGTVEQLKGQYECHILTLPGFGNQPPISAPYVSHVRDDIIAYVRAKKLDHPAVIGHSLGGFMVYCLGEAEPKLWGPLIAVDGLPFLPLIQNPNATEDTMKPLADQALKQIESATPDQFKATTKSTLAREITDPKDVDAMYVFSSEADQRTVGEAMKELLTIDLRGDLPKIQSPFLLIGAGQQANNDAMKKWLSDAYGSQIKTIPNGKLVMDWKARHFAMLDDRDGFYKDIKEFLQANEK